MHWFSSLKIKARLMVAFFIVAIVAGLSGYVAAVTGTIWSVAALIVGISLTIFGASVSANQTNGLINKIIAATKNIAQGNIDFTVSTGESFEAHMLDNSFSEMMIAIKAMVKDVEMLNDAMSEGKLDVRADASQHKGEYGVIVAGLNASLDAVIGPLNVAAEYVERISKGDIPAKISDDYNGDFNEIKNNLNHCIDGMGGLVESCSVLTKLSINDYTTQVQGRYQGIFKETAKNVNLLRAILMLIVEGNEAIAAGDFEEIYQRNIAWGKRCEEDRMGPSYVKLMENIRRLVADANMLAEGAVKGKLDIRADANQHQGDYRKVIEGFNNTLDAVIGPLNVAAEYVERISKGDIPAKITDSYNGDFNEIKNNLNHCIDGMGGLVESCNVLKKLSMNDYTTQVEGYYQGIFKETADNVNLIRAIMLLVVEANEKIAAGDFEEELQKNITWGKRCEEDRLVPSFIMVMENIKRLVEDAQMLSGGAIAGKLDIRADASQHQGEYRKVIEGFNNTLDAVIGPLNVAAEYIERIGKGERVAKITDEYAGDFNEIKSNINSCIDGLGGLVESSNVLTQMARNNYTIKVEGHYQGLFAETAENINTVRERILTSIMANEKIAAGNFDEMYNQFKKIGKRCEEDRLIPSYLAIIENIQRLIDDAETLGNAAVEGKLDTRADASQHLGEYRKVIDGFNNTLDAVIGPLNVAAEYIERIGNGDVLAKITDDYNGDFNEIKNNINNCIDGLGGLIECSNVLKKMAVNDHTSRVEGNYQGVFAETAVGVNTVRERLLNVVNVNTHIAEGNFAADLEAYRKVGKRSEEDKLVPSMIMSMENIQRLVKDAEMLTEGAIAGKLDLRADAMQHQGEYRKVIEGFNDTLDAVIGPLNVAAEYIERIANGNTPPKITDEYNGDFNEIKNNLNTCIDAISVMVDEIGVAIAAGVEGRLDQRANADRSKGVYHKILAGVNATMDALIAPVNEAIPVVEQLALGLLDMKMTGNYQGDNAKLKDALNSTLATLSDVIGEVSESLGQISNGNLAITIEKDYPGEFSNISSAIKHILEALNEIMGDINHAAEQVANGAEQVSDSSQALAQGANEQASAIEQLTSAITEIAAQTRQNAANANQANELALNARDNAAQGNNQMKEMLGAMEGINDSSANISKIIKVIDEIAFQTNILALNAAVEAARAGQHGKGFAVVAEEVRNLAARSASAAKETTDLIEGSIRKVQSGTKIANDTAQALNKIVEGVSQAAVLVGDIAVASNEQATGIAQVDQGIGQVSQVVQTNSATAQESAAASEELSQQAGVLKERVRRFHLRRRKDNFPEAEYKAIGQNPGRQESELYLLGAKEAAAAKSRKAKISLDDGDFGKY